MISEIEKDNFNSVKRLSYNPDFYNQVFKRAERISSVIFYILSHINRDKKTEVHAQNLSDKSMRLHEAALASLNLHEFEAKEGLHDLMQALVATESTLKLAVAAQVVRQDVEQIVATEIDAVQRYVSNHYFNEEVPVALTAAPLPTPKARAERTPRRRPQQSRPLDVSSDAPAVKSTSPDRATLIKTVLEARPQATIKDIASVVTDCSEKTIQRELNSLIELGEVLREGERRWSRYSLVS